MRRIFIYNVWVLTTVVLLASCTPNSVDVYQGPDLVHFLTTQDRLIVGEEDPVIKIEIGTSVPHSQDRNYSVSIEVEGTTAIEGESFEFIDDKVIIPAGEVLGSFEVRGLFAGALVEGARLNLTLSDPSHGEVAGFDDVFSLDFYKYCKFDQAAFIGTFTTYEHSYWGEFEYEVSTVAAGPFSVYVDGLWAVTGSKIEISFNRDSTNCYINDQWLFTNQSYGEVYIYSYEDGVYNSCTGTIEGLTCYVYEKNKETLYDIVTFDMYNNELVNVQSTFTRTGKMDLTDRDIKIIDWPE